ncbi:MAG: hypothetical protein LBD59_05140 [Prevotellaceae bacterium]|jgi:hypothetical protein|nr:hypothetical protein [Prevotellaceae bacterium]
MKKIYLLKSVASFSLVLFTMPLGHALMITMEHLLTPTALHASAFTMGAVGVTTVIVGVFAKGDVRQTLCGLLGGLLFWTGWVEFLFMYYAHRHGTQPEIVDGEIVTKPEYLLYPATFGFWVMFMLVYLFCTQSGCQFFNWCQKTLFGSRRGDIVARPMTRHTSMVTFMELNMLLWTSYLLLMFCYDGNFLGDRHPVTILIAAGCLIAAALMFLRQLKIGSWGANIRFSIATVIVLWTPIEVMGRMNLFKEIWVEPMRYKTEMIILSLAFLALVCYLYFAAKKKKDNGMENIRRYKNKTTDNK